MSISRSGCRSGWSYKYTTASVLLRSTEITVSSDFLKRKKCVHRYVHILILIPRPRNQITILVEFYSYLRKILKLNLVYSHHGTMIKGETQHRLGVIPNRSSEIHPMSWHCAQHSCRFLTGCCTRQESLFFSSFWSIAMNGQRQPAIRIPSSSVRGTPG